MSTKQSILVSVSVSRFLVEGYLEIRELVMNQKMCKQSVSQEVKAITELFY